jgi:D-tagatose-1,6-bisphosphate aldolase subunit GatZ/KbaZ
LLLLSYANMIAQFAAYANKIERSFPKMSERLKQLLANRKHKSAARGIYSVCSAHPWVLRAALQQAKESGGSLLIEATSNQVNQFGGYTGMQPADFYRLVLGLAQQEQFPAEGLILGGDHLGPNPWQNLPAEEAMAHAETMVAAYAVAGFTKLHLDASMPCADDPSTLSDAVVAERAARLCHAAEQAAPGKTLLYIIGTEVPTPGGATEGLGHLHVTTKQAALQTLEVHERVFVEHGLTNVWPRVVAVVVQPGVEFNHDSVVFYQADKATDLVTLLADRGTLVFEAHSTDYQLPSGYQELVRDGFAILKVGPALTFAMREALFALAEIEAMLFPENEQSRLPEIIDQAMLRKPKDWAKHYEGTVEEQAVLRRFSYSDRIRYYWNDPDVLEAVAKLLRNLEKKSIPETLISAYLPEQYSRMRVELHSLLPEDLVLDRIRQALEPYVAACAAPPSSGSTVTL